jgi:hypothetical protein
MMGYVGRVAILGLRVRVRFKVLGVRARVGVRCKGSGLGLDFKVGFRVREGLGRLTSHCIRRIKTCLHRFAFVDRQECKIGHRAPHASIREVWKPNLKNTTQQNTIEQDMT